jgi:hypothetical protein
MTQGTNCSCNCNYDHSCSYIFVNIALPWNCAFDKGVCIKCVYFIISYSLCLTIGVTNSWRDSFESVWTFLSREMIAYISSLRNILDVFYRKVPVFFPTQILGCVHVCRSTARAVNRFVFVFAPEKRVSCMFRWKVLHHLCYFKYLKKDDCNSKQNW